MVLVVPVALQVLVQLLVALVEELLLGLHYYAWEKVASLSSNSNILLAKWHHLTPTLLGNFEVILLRVSSELRPSIYFRVLTACSQITKKSALLETHTIPFPYRRPSVQFILFIL